MPFFMRAQLVPLDGGPCVDIAKEMMLIGRQEDCDLRLDHKSVSKMHCVLVKTDGLILLRDLGSTNGTRVNGTRVRRAALLPNDKLSVANFHYKVLFGAALAAVDPAIKRSASNPARSARCSPITIIWPTANPISRFWKCFRMRCRTCIRMTKRGSAGDPVRCGLTPVKGGPMHSNALLSIQRELPSLSRDEQLWLIEHLAKGLRKQPKPFNFDADLVAMANDPQIQAEIRAINEEFALAEQDGLETLE